MNQSPGKAVLPGVAVDNVDRAEALRLTFSRRKAGKQTLVVTPNAEIAFRASKDPAFSALLASADLVLPDGQGVVLASRLLGTPLKTKVAGIDYGEALLRLAAAHGLSVFFYGGKPGVAEAAAEKTAERFFADAEIAGAFRRSSASDESVECCCLWSGLPVYNARLTFDFSGDNLFMVTGTMLFTKEAERSTAGVMDAVSVLMRFVEIVRSEGFICSRLDALTPGYLMSVAVSGESTLTPVWHIETDTGDLYVNALNGRTETVG